MDSPELGKPNGSGKTCIPTHLSAAYAASVRPGNRFTEARSGNRFAEAAQETAAPEPAKETASPEPAKEPEAPAPVFGMETTGTLDLGYRWNVGLRGSEDLYRSLVNLGEGPRLLGANLTMSSPLGAGKYIDRLQLNASAWGGDPYNTLRLFAEKSGVYQFSFDYRKVDYFNFIPTFANPLLAQGIFLGQHSFDSTRRTMDFDLTLRPGATVSPFIAYSRNSGFGPGVTTFTADENEFAVTNQLRDTSDYYRGGVHFNWSRMNLTLEQGFLTFKDDQRIYQTGGTNTGNRTTPVLGQNVVLGQLDENYHSRGTTPVSRVQLTATPWDKLTVAGRFVYSQPDLDFDYDRRTAGNFVSQDVLRVFTGELANASSEASRPHILGKPVGGVPTHRAGADSGVSGHRPVSHCFVVFAGPFAHRHPAPLGTRGPEQHFRDRRGRFQSLCRQPEPEPIGRSRGFDLAPLGAWRLQGSLVRHAAAVSGVGGRSGGEPQPGYRAGRFQLSSAAQSRCLFGF